MLFKSVSIQAYEGFKYQIFGITLGNIKIDPPGLIKTYSVFRIFESNGTGSIHFSFHHSAKTFLAPQLWTKLVCVMSKPSATESVEGDPH